MTSGKMDFSMNAESISPATEETASKNQKQIDMIVELLNGVRTDFVTRHIKDDLDRIQTLVKNVTYREAAQTSRVVPVHFTELQRAVIKMVSRQSEDKSSSGSVKDSEMPVTDAQHGLVPQLTYPYQKLNLVPTRLSTISKKKK